MATERLRTIKPSGQGGDYTSVNGWEAGEQADLPTLDEIRIGEVQGDWSGVTDGTVTVDGWITDSTRYPVIRAVGAARHSGVWDTTKYTRDRIALYEPYTRVDGVQINVDTNSSSAVSGVHNYTPSGSTGDAQISNVLVRLNNSQSGTGFRRGFGSQSSIGNNLYIRNCVVFVGPVPPSGGSEGYKGYGTGWRAYNCIAYGVGVGFLRAAGTFIAKNCIAKACTTTGIASSLSASCNTNISDTETPPGSNAINGTIQFVDVANGDFRLSAADTLAIDAGLNLSTDADYPFTDDASGSTRSGSWDIGILEYVATGGTDATATPSGVSISGSVGTLVLTATALVSPAGVAVVSYVGTPSASGSSMVSATGAPSGVLATGYIGSPVCSGAARASPSGVSAVPSVGSFLARAAATALALGVSALAAVGIPVGIGGGLGPPTVFIIGRSQRWTRL